MLWGFQELAECYFIVDLLVVTTHWLHIPLQKKCVNTAVGTHKTVTYGAVKCSYFYIKTSVNLLLYTHGPIVIPLYSDNFFVII